MQYSTLEVIMTFSTSPLAVTDIGTGASATVHLPGWCGGRDVFAPLLAADGGGRRISVDLPGQGQSVAPAGNFTSAEVVADVLALVEHLGLDRVVPVALAHAGWFAIELRRALGPEQVPGIVLVDWMPIGAPPGFLDALAELQNPNAWADVRAHLFEMWTSGIDDRAVHDYVASMGEYGFDMWSRAGREIAQAFVQHGTPVAALTELAEEQGVDCPTLHLYAQPDDDAYLAAQQGFGAEHPWFQVHRLAAASHFPTLEVPDVIATRIDEFTGALRFAE
jgi:pimeloyl-ACP methyl ester carboxylesterase